MELIQRALLNGYDSVHRRTDRRTDRQTGRRMDKVKPVYPLSTSLTRCILITLPSRNCMQLNTALILKLDEIMHAGKPLLKSVEATCVYSPPGIYKTPYAFNIHVILILREAIIHIQCFHHGPLTRYGKLQVAHAPGMPGTFPPATNFKGNR